MEQEPILFHLRKLLGSQKPVTLDSICDKSWEIAPGGRGDFPSAIFLPKHLSMNLKAVPGVTLNYELKRVNERQVEHSPTVAYQINEAKVLNGLLYKNKFRLRLNNKKESILNSFGYIQKEAEGILVSSWSSNTYFGHWIHDECPRVLISQDIGVPAYSTYRNLYSHQLGYENIFNINFHSVKRAIFKKMIFLSDATLNDYRQKKLLQLRALAQKSIPENNNYIYIKRGNGGVKGRDLVNQKKIIVKLISYGFTIINPEKLSANQILKKCLNAKVIMGVEGSSLAHGFLGVNSTGMIIALVPEYRFTNPFNDYCSSIGLRYGFLVGKTVEGGFDVDLDDMDELLSLVL